MKLVFTAATTLFALTSAASAQSNSLNEGHLKALDADGDASISMSEFEAFSDFAFQEMDLNNDGSLSRSEGAPHLDSQSFSRADENGDGAITSNEFRNRMRANFKAADKDGDGVLD